MALKDYRIAVGHNVALGSLSNIEDVIYPYTSLRFLPPASQPVNTFPVRRVPLSGQARGDGRIDHVWTWSVLPAAAVKRMVDLYFSSGTVVSTAVTIYTRRHELATYTRYNAYAELFVPGADMNYDRRHFRGVQLRFTKLTTPS